MSDDKPDDKKPTVRIKPNNKCGSCQHYVEERCRERSVPRFCEARYLKIA